jgi:uncharacterized Ntn-hydrolase superfamily protein
MTWSIVARDAASGAFGVAVTTKAFAMGARCPHAMSGVGAIATQSFTNPMFGTRGLRLLQEGVAAQDVVAILTDGDEGRAIRQLHLIDAKGRNAAYTGASCIDWCGHRLGDGISVAGNMLAGKAVVDDSFESYVTATAAGTQTFAERLIGALDAGQAAGGDKRGKQSAALIIYTSEEYPALSLRVDDHAEPLGELRRLHDEAQRYFLPFSRFLPTRASPAGIHDRAVINAEIARLQTADKS